MDRPFQCSQLAKKGVALLSSLLLAFALCMTFAPTTARADTTKAEVKAADCTVIGTYELMDEANIYYVALDSYADEVAFTDFTLEDMEDGFIVGLHAQAYMVPDTNETPLNVDCKITLEGLEDDDSATLDEDAIEGLDFGNAYAFYVLTGEYEEYVFIVQVPAPAEWDGPFVPSVGGTPEFVEDGYTYTQWVQDEDGNWNPVETIADLYVLTVPYGTPALELDFKGIPLIAYGYDEGGNYIDTGAADKDRGYGSNGQIGEPTASFYANSAGELPAFIWVQEPYDENWSSEFLYAIQINYVASFTAYVDGEELEVIAFDPEGYVGATYGGATTVPVFVVEIPQGTESVDLVFSDNVLAYNYTKDGEYLYGYYPGDTWMTGADTATVPVDYGNETTPADGEIDYIQVQGPYDAAWNSPLYYAITFEYERIMPDDVVDIYMSTRDRVYGILSESQTYDSSAWYILGMERGWHVDAGAYYRDVIKTLRDNDGTLGASAPSTDYARTILALTAAGYDPTNLGGYDLLPGLADYGKITSQGLNSVCYALLALDSHDYEVPEAPAGATQTTREKLISYILDRELDGGGWTYSGNVADVDMTAIAIQALAPYYDSDENVKAAVDRGLEKLSSMQTETGGFKAELGDGGNENSCSIAQVIVALTALDINPTTDDRFIKDGHNAIDALCAYASDGGGFGWTNTTFDARSTGQGFYALVAYQRFIDRNTSLYDMSDKNLRTSPMKLDGTKYHIISKADPAFVLDVAYEQPVKGSNVSIWTNNGGANQMFTFDYGDHGGIVFRNVANPDLVLDAENDVPFEGSNVSTWTYNGGLNQEWEIVQVTADGYFRIENWANGSLCLDAAGDTPEIGANVSAWTVKTESNDNQLWKIVEANDLAGATVTAQGMVRNLIDGEAAAPVVKVVMNAEVLVEGADYELYYDDGETVSKDVPTEPGMYVVTAKAVDGGKCIGEKKVGVYNIAPAPEAIAPDKAFRIVSAADPDFILDVAYAEPVTGSNVSVWTSNGGANQLFTVEATDDGYYVLRNVANADLVLDAENDVPFKGSNVSTWIYNEGLNQKWVFLPASEGKFFIASAANPSLVLDAAGDVPEIGANVSAWTAKSESNLNQLWSLVSADDLAYAEAATSGLERNATGSALAPEVSISLNGKALVEGADYDVRFDGSVERPSAPGTYKVTVEGKGTYEGSIGVCDFTIHPAPVEVGDAHAFHIVSAFDDGFVLDVENDVPFKGSNVSIWTDNGGANQMFTLELAADGYYVLRNVADAELVLDAAGDVPEIGANVSTWTFKAENNLNQKWVLVPSADSPGYFFIASAANPALVLDAAGDAPVIGANVSAWTAKETSNLNQLWKLSKKLEPIEIVRAAIQALSADPTEFTAADKETVEAIWTDFQALGGGDQAILDSEFSHSGTGQSLGRVLETAVWAVWSYETDDSTTLPNGTYTTSTTPAVSSFSDKGKSDSSRVRNWWVESVKVSNGKATAYIYVTSGAPSAKKLTSYPSIWAGGKTIDRNADNNYPIPVDLNGVTYFGGISSSMPTPIMYALTTEIDESWSLEPIELEITNNTAMFKAVTASAVENTDGSATLTFALSGTGYHYLYKGTFEQAVANGEATENWIAGYQNGDGKWEFQIPVAADELGKDVPVVAISDREYNNHVTNPDQTPLARAFYPRQFNLNLDAATLVTGDFATTKDLEVTKEAGLMMSVSSAMLDMVGGPNSNNYKADLVLTMGSTSYSKAFVGTPDEAAAATETIAIADDQSFTIPVKWLATFGDPTSVVSLANGEPFVVSLWSVKNEQWYPRAFTLNEDAGTLYLASWTEPVSGDSVDDLIAKIQVQYFTETTWADCEAAKAAWDALTDEEKEAVEEYDYFGLDTGDASLDDPLNQDNIGENEILVVSFGTSFNDSRVATIGGVEKAIAQAYPDWSVRRAFTAQIIINHIYARDGEKIDNMQQALDRAVANGVKNLVVQPTHLMHGAEYDELVAALAPYESKFESVKVAEPLLGEVGADATVINADKRAVADFVVANAFSEAGYDYAGAAASDGVALVLMGHGTEHVANITYSQMQTAMNELGYSNVFIGTVEGLPADTECSVVIDKVKAAGYTKVILRPLMVVAGDHANNDMADPEDEESWYSQFTADGSFSSVTCQIMGLGQIPAVQQLYVAHVADAIAGGEPALIDLSDATVTVDPESVLYDGQSHAPNITVSFGDKVLVAEQDYQIAVSGVSSSNGTTPGMIAYDIRGVEAAGYTGQTFAYFEIIGPADPFDYPGDDVTFINVEGKGFGMFDALDGTTIALEGDNVVIHYVPKNTTIYAGFYLNADIRFASTWSEASYFALTDGSFDITLPKSYCGKALPVSPVKVSDGGTTSTQYYLAIPSEDKLA